MKRLRISLLFLLLSVWSFGQGIADTSTLSLPSAPVPSMAPQSGGSIAPQMSPQASASQAAPGSPTILSVTDAQALALKNNPQISVARLNALASQQVTREVRSALWPTARVDLTAVDANPGSRITAGALNNPSLYQR